MTNMSTTLVPPTYYVVKPYGQAPRVFTTVAQAATALTGLGDKPTSIRVITGSRVRRLNQREISELRSRLSTRNRTGPNGSTWSRPRRPNPPRKAGPAPKLENHRPASV